MDDHQHADPAGGGSANNNGKRPSGSRRIWLFALVTLIASGLLLQALPLLFLIGLFAFGTRMLRGQQQGDFNAGQSKAKVYTAERPGTVLADVAGIEAANAELYEEVDYLRDPAKYRQLGARIPKAWVNFMMRFELGLEGPDPRRTLASALTIAGAYIAGG